MEIIKFDNIYEMTESLSKEKVMVIDDNCNSYIAIKSENNLLIGIGYYSLGIPEDSYFDKNNNLLYIGVGKNVICLDLFSCKSILNSRLSSVFYNFLIQNEDSKVIVICELDVYCFSYSKLVWRISFRDMVAEATMLERSVLKVILVDNSEILISIIEGKYIS